LHEIEQAPREQLGVPLVALHAVPHAPQLLTLVWVLVSQPLLGLPSQLPNPGLQLGEQLPDTQAVEPLAFVQVTPQEPQVVVVVRSASHPLPDTPSQLA